MPIGALTAGIIGTNLIGGFLGNNTVSYTHLTLPTTPYV